MRFDYWFAYLGGIIFPESYVNNDWYAFHTSCDNVNGIASCTAVCKVLSKIHADMISTCDRGNI
jgi:hypothetical protein